VVPPDFTRDNPRLVSLNVSDRRRLIVSFLRRCSGMTGRPPYNALTAYARLSEYGILTDLFPSLHLPHYNIFFCICQDFCPHLKQEIKNPHFDSEIFIIKAV
jgi:hypothetical protein